MIKLPVVVLLTLLIYGEARGEDLTGKAAVAWVAMNRSLMWHKPLKDIILQPKQFSCFNDNDPNLSRLQMLADDFTDNLFHNPVVRECYWVARGVLERWIKDPTGGATHYHAFYIHPYWAAQMKEVARIDNHIFYAERRTKTVATHRGDTPGRG